VQATEIRGREAADLGIAVALAAPPANHPARERRGGQQEKEPEPFGHERHEVTLPASGWPSVFVGQGHDVADTLAQLLAGLEMRHVLARQGHGGPRLRVAAGTRRPVMEREAAETADLDALAAG